MTKRSHFKVNRQHILIATLLLGIIIYLSFHQQSTQIYKQTQPISASAIPFAQGSFQELLNKSCYLKKLENYDVTNGVPMDKYSTIDFDKLPIITSINPLPETNCFIETYDDNINVDRDLKANHQGVVLNFNQQAIWLRDNSRPLIDGSNSGSVLVKNDHQINYYASMGTGGDGGFYTTKIYWWGVREITLKTGEKIYLTGKTQQGSGGIYIASDDQPLPTPQGSYDEKTFRQATIQDYFKAHPLTASQTQSVEELLTSIQVK